MRDKNRIPVVLSKLQAVWEKYPDLRLSQLILNLEHSTPMLYQVEDEELIKLLDQMYKSNQKAD